MAKQSKNELMEALLYLEKEKNIKREFVFEQIENALLIACKNHFQTNDNAVVDINPESGQYRVFLRKEVVDDVTDDIHQISLAEARAISKEAEVGQTVDVEIKSTEFGRIAAKSAKDVLLQNLRKEEQRVISDEYKELQGTIVTGVVQRFTGKNGKDIAIELGKTEAFLPEKEQVPSEHFKPQDRIKVYIASVTDKKNNTRITVSRTHPKLVEKLFEEEVSEVRDGIVEIKSIAREAGSRTKIAVWSNDPDVDPVGACVGMNGARVNAIVDELGDEKIDIVEWDDVPAYLIENALSPSKVVAVLADADDKTAKVVVPDYQLSLAIGKEGQNARLAAKLTNYKIDIKSETQAREAGPDFIDFGDDYYDDEDEYYDDEEYSDDYDDEYYEEEADVELADSEDYEEEVETEEAPAEEEGTEE